jgi:hypothetical protein
MRFIHGRRTILFFERGLPLLKADQGMTTAVSNGLTLLIDAVQSMAASVVRAALAWRRPSVGTQAR